MTRSVQACVVFPGVSRLVFVLMMVIAVLVLVLSGQDAHSAATTVVLVAGAAESAIRLLGPAPAGRKDRPSVRGRSE
ncbi:hypothetical protein [Streptomyces sp. NPDC057238]|uniref:hypothetical protein n=1 Tax=Streptomyces sp. NPDC057238 TaxID=3346060 RepID=UPI0036345351